MPEQGITRRWISHNSTFEATYSTERSGRKLVRLNIETEGQFLDAGRWKSGRVHISLQQDDLDDIEQWTSSTFREGRE